MPLRIPASAIAGLLIAAIYVAVLMWSISRGDDPTEYLIILAIFAVVFPLAARLTTLGVRGIRGIGCDAWAVRTRGADADPWSVRDR